MSVSHNNKAERIVEVDVLKGIGIFAVILIHCTVLFTSNPIAYLLWDANQYAVQAFVFSSSYLYFLKNKDVEGIKNIIQVVSKRISRLLIPYYIYAILLVTFYFFFDRARLTISYLYQSLIVTGGIDISWLVLLFIQFSILFPILILLRKRSEFWFWAIGVFTVLSSIWLLFYKSPVHYKIIMWLPWLSIVYFAALYIEVVKKKISLIYLFLAVLFIFTLSYIFQSTQDHSLKFFNNKYPPNLYYLSYGTAWIAIVGYLSKKGFFSRIEKFLVFLSKNAYSLFFIHYLYIIVITKLFAFKKLEWYGFFALIFILSIFTQMLLNTVRFYLNHGHLHK